MEIENKIKLAHVSKVFIKDFDEMMNDFEGEEFIVFLIHNADKVQTGISKSLSERIFKTIVAGL